MKYKLSGSNKEVTIGYNSGVKTGRWNLIKDLWVIYRSKSNKKYNYSELHQINIELE